MVEGIYLSLFVGPLVPIPAPRAVVDALTAVEARISSRGASGFQLSFALGKNSPLLTLFLLAGGAPTPPLRVLLVVTIRGVPEVVFDGIMTHHQTTPGSGGQPATLTVSGTDLTALMDLIPFDGLPYPAMPVEARVFLILAKYAALGVIPLVVPRLFLDVDNPLDRFTRHKGTDLAYLNLLASAAGYVFYVDPGPVPGANKAYWGPEIRLGVPQPALTVDADAHTNVEQLSFTYRSDDRTQPYVWVQNSLTKIPIPVPIPDLSGLLSPLALIPPTPRKFESLDDTAKRSIPEAILAGLAKAACHGDATEGTGRLDVLRYGRLLKARGLVGVRGAGTAFDGLYYVNEVTHSIKRGEYKQSFKLSRDGLMSTVPKVPV
jgi:hypothetical protein